MLGFISLFPIIQIRNVVTLSIKITKGNKTKKNPTVRLENFKSDRKKSIDMVDTTADIKNKIKPSLKISL